MRRTANEGIAPSAVENYCPASKERPFAAAIDSGCAGLSFAVRLSSKERNNPMNARHFVDAEAVVAALQPGHPVYCLRPVELRAAAKRFLESFPGRVLYAVKCNPHPLVLKTLFDAGIHNFDAASLGEIALVSEMDKSAISYFMHPIKIRKEVISAYKNYGVKYFVIDHIDELQKIQQETKGGRGVAVLVRFATPGGVARYELSRKFGATVEDACSLLRVVRDAGFEPGLAFHVGSQCHSPDAFLSALLLTGAIIEQAGVELRYLDVGGGFPTSYLNDDPPPLSEYFRAIKLGIAELGLAENCTIMCEPGRALVAAACSLIVQVLLRKEDAIYINDGVYHSFAETVTGGLKPPVRLIRPGEPHAEETGEFTVYGPTCDNTDCLPYRLPIPVDVREGDWLELGQMGAYSNAMASTFNGFHPDTFVTVDAPPFLPETSLTAGATDRRNSSSNTPVSQ